jgi:hypothetical protein
MRKQTFGEVMALVRAQSSNKRVEIKRKLTVPSSYNNNVGFSVFSAYFEVFALKTEEPGRSSRSERVKRVKELKRVQKSEKFKE